MSQSRRPDLLLPAIACLTLGLAPFWPLPHVAEKLLWLVQGSHTLRAIDWFDLALHGGPWLWLAWTAWRRRR